MVVVLAGEGSSGVPGDYVEAMSGEYALVGNEDKKELIVHGVQKKRSIGAPAGVVNTGSTSFLSEARYGRCQRSGVPGCPSVASSSRADAFAVAAAI